MQPKSFSADLIRSLAVLAVIFSALIAVSYGISTYREALGPVVANIIWGAALVATVVYGLKAARYGLALAPVVFVVLWAAGSQIYAGLQTAESGVRDGLTSVPDVRPVSRLIVNASYGLPIDPTRSGGVSLARFDTCGAWCRDLLLEKGLGSVVLWTPRPDNPTARTLFRAGGEGECTAGNSPCIVEEQTEAFPDGLMIEFGDEAGPAADAGICCPVAIVSRIEGGKKTVIKSYRQGSNMAVLAVPVIAATGKPFASPPIKMTNMALGPPLRFDTLVEALLETQLKWK